jgi:valyl-tRNA synthetase
LPEAEEEMAYLIDAVSGIRNIRGEVNIPPADELDVHIKALSQKAEAALGNNLRYITKLARAKSVNIGMDIKKPKGSYTSVKNGLEVYVTLKGIINLEAERERLGKEKKKLEESILFLQRKLHNEEFLNRAPKDVVGKERQRYEELVSRQEKILESIEKIKSLEV